jgi:hypothetical protein
MDIALVVLLGIVGAALVLGTVVSAAETLAVPRGTPVLITRWVFVAWGFVFGLVRRSRDVRRQDRVLALYAPISLLSLPLVWLGMLGLGFAALYRATGQSWPQALLESGSSLFTLGFRSPNSGLVAALVFLESLLGLGLLALMVSYLPSIYGSYSRREILVTSLETQAGSPPSAQELLTRLARIDGLPETDAFWQDWTRWFAEIEETHTTAPSLVFFRSPQPSRSWITAAGAVLDAAALVASALDVPRRPAAELCIRAGYLALRRIGDYFVMPYDPDPAPDDPISVRRDEFDTVCAALALAGAPLRADRDRAWRDFAGWRVNYDQVLLRFASLCIAPSAPWSADRPIPFHRAPVTRRKARSRL